MTKVIRIDPSGEVTKLEGTDMLALAIEGLAHVGGYTGSPDLPGMGTVHISESEPTLDLVSARPNGVSPWPAGARLIVIAVHQWGRNMDLPVNRKAWGLYGLSPLCGPAFVALDTDDEGYRADLDEDFIAQLRAPATWLTADVTRRMEAIADAEGCRWL